MIVNEVVLNISFIDNKDDNSCIVRREFVDQEKFLLNMRQILVFETDTHMYNCIHVHIVEMDKLPLL